MKQLGYRVFSERGFHIYEVLRAHADDRSIVGFAISGNGLEPMILYASLAEAKAALCRLSGNWTPHPDFHHA